MENLIARLTREDPLDGSFQRSQPQEPESEEAGIPGISEADRILILEAALECLPALRQSIENRHIGSQLLRPADGNRTPSEVLLRPAAPQASSDPPDQLLRSTNDAA